MTLRGKFKFKKNQ